MSPNAEVCNVSSDIVAESLATSTQLAAHMNQHTGSEARGTARELSAEPAPRVVEL